MATQIATRRTESADRWMKALDRALANGLEVFVVNDTGERMVTSASQLDTLYRTNGRHCTCAAALAGDPVCQHRAVVRYVMGWLGEPSPSSPAARPAVTRRCLSCTAGKVETWGVSGPIGWTACSVCGGTGALPAPQPQPEAAPVFDLTTFLWGDLPKPKTPASRKRAA
jgi:hypothetical protein